MSLQDVVRRGIADMDRLGIRPIKFPDCRGHIEIRNGQPDHTHDDCFTCSRNSNGQGGNDYWRAELSPDLGHICANRIAVLTPAERDAMDETAGITHTHTVVGPA